MFHERFVRPDGAVLELAFASAQDYRLACVHEGRVLVEFASGGRHPFRSVEQLRYDFEQAVADALPPG